MIIYILNILYSFISCYMVSNNTFSPQKMCINCSSFFLYHHYLFDVYMIIYILNILYYVISCNMVYNTTPPPKNVHKLSIFFLVSPLFILCIFDNLHTKYPILVLNLVIWLTIPPPQNKLKIKSEALHLLSCTTSIYSIYF